MKEKESKLFFTLSNKTRIDILKELTKNELSLSEVAQKTGSLLQIIQRHAKLLTDNMLVKRDGKHHIHQYR